MDALIPSPHLIAFEKLTVSGLEMTIEAKTTRTVVHCPECQHPTQKVHSSYQRRPRDLPTAGLSVRLLLHTRKFFCENTGCSRTIFCERLPECVEKYAHGTARLNQHQTWLGLALGGELGSRLADKLGYPVSAATLLSVTDGETPSRTSTPTWDLGHHRGTPLSASTTTGATSQGMAAGLQGRSRTETSGTTVSSLTRERP